MKRKRSYIATVECRVLKEVVCEAPSSEAVWECPWDHVESEEEVSMRDWEVLAVREND